MKAFEARCAETGIVPALPRIDTMHRDACFDRASPIDPEARPEAITNRDEERAALIDTFSDDDLDHLYIHGPRGTGKTLLTRTCAEECAPSSTCFISCTQYDTQYKVLRQMHRALSGRDINHGYHTAQLQRRVTDQLADRSLLLILDEIDFLLENDGADLLYHLSRTDHRDNLHLVAISANYPDLHSVTDTRALSSLQPWYMTFEQYSATQAYEILKVRLRMGGVLEAVDREALTMLVATTRNIQLGLYWLAQAASTAESRITTDLLRTVKQAAVYRYHQSLLSDFSSAHHTLLEAISQLVVEHDDGVRSGHIYDRYADLCQATGKEQLSQRRISDLLTHLELLNIIEIDHHQGGTKGRTRKVTLNTVL